MTTKTVKPETPAQVPADAPLIVPNATRSAGTSAVLEYLARCWPQSAWRPELADIFSLGDNKPNGEKTMSKRFASALANLEKSNYITRRGIGQDCEWTLGPAAQLIGTTELPQQPEPDLPTWVGEPAPVRQPEVMTAPDFKPKPMQALRPGAQDFMRCPSRGARC